MTPLLLALAVQAAAPPAPPAAAANPPQSDEAQFRTCTTLARSSPDQAVAAANEWLVRGGGMFARQCLGLAYSGLGRWASAATAFEQLAREAETTQDPRRADFWVQAGNAHLAGGKAAEARAAFNAALATTALGNELRGEVHLDRARAAVALNDLASARADIDQGVKLVPGDAFGWYLSSALALKEGSLARAQDDIARALGLAPDDPDLLVHAGNLAGISGEHAAAEGLFMKAIRLAPGSAVAKAAEAALAANKGLAQQPKR